MCKLFIMIIFYICAERTGILFYLRNLNVIFFYYLLWLFSIIFNFTYFWRHSPYYNIFNCIYTWTFDLEFPTSFQFSYSHTICTISFSALYFFRLALNIINLYIFL